MPASPEKPTLYALLGVSATASVPDIRAAYRVALDALEAQRRTLPPAEFDERLQLLRLASSTLTDALSRDDYDASLRAAEQARHGRALALAPAAAGAADEAAARAEAMALRADAMALRADAVLLRAGLAPAPASGTGDTIARGLLSGASRALGAFVLLLVLGMTAFTLTRCSSMNSMEQRAAVEQKMAEQAALQDYYQTHGVRPSSIAEMEKMEAARRAEERDQRQLEQARREREQAARRFEEESRRIGAQVSENLQRAEEAEQRRAERQRQLKYRAEQLKLESELARNEADRRRLELMRQQTLEELKQL